MVANGVFMVVEVAGGIAFQSLALLADAAHMLSDVAGLGIALVAQSLVDRRATARHSYGLQRAEVLGRAGQRPRSARGLRLDHLRSGRPHRRRPLIVAGVGLLVVATLGLVVNVGSAILLARAQGQSLNMRGAFVHMATDAAGSLAAIVAGVAVVVWNADWVDPVASILIAVLVLWSAWGLLRDTAQVLLEGTPRGMNPASVEAALAADAEVEAVHHLHLWNLASDVPALSAHVVLRGEVSLHDAQASGDRLKELLVARFGINHATLELECHPCDPAPDEHTRSGDGHRH